MKRAMVFGSSGQVASYLVDHLQTLGYDVFGVSKDMVNYELEQPRHLRQVVRDLLVRFQPHEIYNLTGKMFAEYSWQDPSGYMTVNGTSVLEVLSAVLDVCPKARFFQAGSADVFDCTSPWPKSETSPRRPSSPYGLSKLVAEEAVRFYREQKGLYACTGIMFNAESPRRKASFFAEKVALEVAKIASDRKTGKKPEPIVLRSTVAVRDWGLTSEYVEAMPLMLAQLEPEDYVLATGESHTCGEFLDAAFEEARLSKQDRQDLVHYVGGTENLTVSYMRACVDKATRGLKWSARSKFTKVVGSLVQAAMAEVIVDVT